MSDEQAALSGGEAVTYPTADSSPMSVEDAARSLTDARNKAQAKPAEAPEQATAEPELAVEADAAPPEEATGETQEDAPAEVPPRDLPRSWTKDRTDIWAKLDPATQDILLEQDRKASAEVRRSQNEAAEIRKAAEAARESAEKARQQYEAQLPALMQELQNAQQNTFSDIKTVDDVTKLANEDPFRYLQWQAHQTKLQAVNAENERARGEKSKAEQAEWTKHVQKENELAAELIPDLADKDKGPALMKRAADRLSDLGFKQDELNDYANGKQKLSIYDHRLQQLIADSLKLADIQNAKKAVADKPVPAVQRPGQTKPANTSSLAQIQVLEKQLSSATGDKAARLSAEIWRLEKKTASR
jgi:hypothetical protein